MRRMVRLTGWLVALTCIAAAPTAGSSARTGQGTRARVERPANAILGAGFQDRYATVNGVRLHYVTGGEGPPVLLVPGWPETWIAWRKVMPALAKRFTVIAVDTRGMGDSGRPSAGYDMSTVETDLIELMRHLGHQRFRLVGHDIGVWISFAMAADHPEMVERVAMIDSNIPGVTPPASFFLPKKDNKHSWHFMFNQLDDLPEILTKGRERQFLTWLYANYALKPELLAREDYIRAYSAPGAMTAGFAYYRALPETITQNRRRMETRLAMPVLALGGDHGTADVVAATLRPIAAKLLSAVLPDCGHYVPEECPVELLAELTPFLTRSDER